MPSPPSTPQRAGGERRGRSDGAGRAGISGFPSVTNGERRDLWVGWALIAGVVALLTVVNALTVGDDTPGLDWWEPWAWEGTSAAVVIALAWLPWLALRAAPLGERPWRFVAVHSAAAVAWSVLHVGGFLALRHGIYALAGAQYEYGPVGSEFLYELRKDALAYAAFVTAYWLVARLSARSDAVVAPVSFDIRDGSRIIRVAVADILAVSSAGNYVEFWLADGRRPLMRATLAAIEVELGPFGFARTHRSWLVNGDRVTGLTPDGSGDWTVELGTVTAPVSRRYPDALAVIRG